MRSIIRALPIAIAAIGLSITLAVPLAVSAAGTGKIEPKPKHAQPDPKSQKPYATIPQKPPTPQSTEGTVTLGGPPDLNRILNLLEPPDRNRILTNHEPPDWNRILNLEPPDRNRILTNHEPPDWNRVLGNDEPPERNGTSLDDFIEACKKIDRSSLLSSASNFISTPHMVTPCDAVAKSLDEQRRKDEQLRKERE
jgi:hypothetical protein